MGVISAYNLLRDIEMCIKQGFLYNKASGEEFVKAVIDIDYINNSYKIAIDFLPAGGITYVSARGFPIEDPLYGQGIASGIERFQFLLRSNISKKQIEDVIANLGRTSHYLRDFYKETFQLHTAH